MPPRREGSILKDISSMSDEEIIAELQGPRSFALPLSAFQRQAAERVLAQTRLGEPLPELPHDIRAMSDGDLGRAIDQLCRNSSTPASPAPAGSPLLVGQRRTTYEQLLHVMRTLSSSEEESEGGARKRSRMASDPARMSDTELASALTQRGFTPITPFTGALRSIYEQFYQSLLTPASH